MSGWTKLFGSIVTSSVWLEDSDTLRIWIAMLAMADSSDVVDGTIPGFASLCRVSREIMERAIEKFSSPDPDSRTPDHDGRRIEKVPGRGWKILNRKKYRDMGQDLPGSRAAYFREYRKRSHNNNVAQRCTQQVNVAHNLEVDIDKEKRSNTLVHPQQSFKQFWTLYPKKIGKKAAMKAWDKAKDKPPIEIILQKLSEQIKSEQWKKENGQFIPLPATWLNQGRWDDEPLKKSKWK